jgi:hypothetical protein
MLGNVAEWIDGCTDDSTHRFEDSCMVVGEELVKDEASCDGYDVVSRKEYGPDIGFRCCGRD